jgi:hypothetical protein
LKRNYSITPRNNIPNSGECASRGAEKTIVDISKADFIKKFDSRHIEQVYSENPTGGGLNMEAIIKLSKNGKTFLYIKNFYYNDDLDYSKCTLLSRYIIR